MKCQVVKGENLALYVKGYPLFDIGPFLKLAITVRFTPLFGQKLFLVSLKFSCVLYSNGQQ